MRLPAVVAYTGILVALSCGTAAASSPLILEAEHGRFSGSVDQHSCWHNVMQSDEPHSTHSGSGVVDTKNEIGSYVEVDYEALEAGPHRVSVRYTHTRKDPRPAELLVNGVVAGTLALPQTLALPAFKTDSLIVTLSAGKNVLRLRATEAGGLPNVDYIKVAEQRTLPAGSLPRIQILEAEDGRYTGKLDHHSCWNFIAQTKAAHSGFTGSGFVDTENKVGSFVEVSVDVPVAGKYRMGVRYVHVKEDERPASIVVNGQDRGIPLLFPRTGWWTAWTLTTTTLELPAGHNVLRLVALGAEGLANIDHIELLALSEEGTPRWSRAYLGRPDAWYSSDEARAVADSVLLYQSSCGGWPKSTDLAAPPRTKEEIPPEGRGRANSFDNDATTVPMEFLARVITATGEAKYRDAFDRGLAFMLTAQYPTGGWPQFWPLRGTEYYSRITFNDGAMIRVMRVLDDVTSGKASYAFTSDDQRSKAAAAVRRGIDCIIKTQVRQDGRPSAWCAQYDEKTLVPAWGRKYEPPSLSGCESVDIVRFLMALDNPSPEIVAAIEGAVDWFRLTPIKGMRLEKTLLSTTKIERRIVPDPAAPPLWARFYELGTNRPLYLDRDSVFHYNFSEVGVERRNGYDYHGNWAAELLETEYPAWRKRACP